MAVTFTGKATLTEPFNLGVDAKVRVTRTDTGPEFMVRFAMATSLADLLTAKVRPEVSADVWQVLDSTVVPFLEVFDRSAVILSTSDGEDDDLGDYVRGDHVLHGGDGRHLRAVPPAQRDVPGAGPG
jgi:hypothetical protein